MSTPLTYTTELAIPDDGGDSDIWGLLLNALFSAWDRHFSGFVAHDMSSADWTLDETEAQCGRIYLTGNPAVARSVILPAKNRTYLVSNFSTATVGQILLSCGAGGDIAIPNGCSMVITCYSATGEIVPCGPPFGRNGGFPDYVRAIGQDWDGPGIFFEGDTNAGFARPSNGNIDVHVSGVAGGPSFRFGGDGDSQYLQFRGAGAFTDYIQTLAAGGTLRFVAGNALRVVIGAGMAVGSANGVVGEGKINATGYYQSGLQLPVGRQFQQTGLPCSANSYGSYAHSKGSAPLHVLARLDCIAPDQGYTVGDRVRVDGGGGNNAIVCGGNATHVFYRVNDAFDLPGKTSAVGSAAINPAAWRVVLTGLWP